MLPSSARALYVRHFLCRLHDLCQKVAVASSVPTSSSGVIVTDHLLCDCTAINTMQYVGLGTRQVRAYDLAFTRHDIPEPLPSPYLAVHPQGYYSIQPPLRIAPCLYKLSTPTHPAGPGGTFPVSISLQFAADRPPTGSLSRSRFASPVVHSIYAFIERRIELYETSGFASPELLSGIGTAATTPDASPASSRTNLLPRHTPEPSPSSSLTVVGANLHAGTHGRKRPRSPAAQQQLLPAKSIVTVLSEAETSTFSPPGANMGSATPSTIEARLDLSLPPRPPPSQWPIGETIKTELATLRFYLRVKVRTSS